MLDIPDEMKRQWIRFQALWRGYYVRQPSINVRSVERIDNFMDSFIQYHNAITNLNYLNIETPRFPHSISLQVVMLVIYHKYKIVPQLGSRQNIVIGNKKVHIKGFSRYAPSSFGKNERWDYLYFVDSRSFKKKKFIVWEIKVSNNDPKWKGLMVNKTESFQEYIEKGKSPRISFLNIVKQLPEETHCVYNGFLENLNI